MGLAYRVIPSILTRGRQQVKGQKFQSWRSVGVTAQAVRVHQKRGVDEVCLLDVGATPEGRGPDLSLIEELTKEMFCPLAVGGGIRSLEDVKNLLRAGADKVVICSALNGALLEEISGVVGAQAIVAAIDVKGGFCYYECGRKTWGGDPVWYAKCYERYGAGEILLTSIDREGTLGGYDLELIQQVCNSVAIPVIAHGGCSGYADMEAAIRCGASAVAAGALFQFTDATPKGAAQYLAKKGIEVRL